MSVRNASDGRAAAIRVGPAVGVAMAPPMAGYGHLPGSRAICAHTFVRAGQLGPRRLSVSGMGQRGGTAAGRTTIRSTVGSPIDVGVPTPAMGGVEAACCSDPALTLFPLAILFPPGADRACAPVAGRGCVAAAAGGWGGVADASPNPDRSSVPAKRARLPSARWAHRAGHPGGAAGFPFAALPDAPASRPKGEAA
jgi:hypothetical protein